MKEFKSCVHDGERYQVATPWKYDRRALPNNYEMSFSCLNKYREAFNNPALTWGTLSERYRILS